MSAYSNSSSSCFNSSQQQQQAQRKSSDLGPRTSVKDDQGSVSISSSSISALTPSSSNHQRRHSTYMLPLLLNERAYLSNRNGDSSDESDNSSDLEPRLSLVSGLKNGAAAAELGERCLANDNRAAAKQQNLLLCSRPANEIPESKGAAQLSGRLDEGLRFANRLAASASSPSALSTPTNERPGAGGCGGPCCSERAQMLKLAAENASLSRQLLLAKTETNVSGSAEPCLQDGSSRSGEPSSLVKSGAQQVAPKWLAQQQLETTKQHITNIERPITGQTTTTTTTTTKRRERLGSNPLDRPTGCAGARLTKQVEPRGSFKKRARKDSCDALQPSSHSKRAARAAAQSSKRHSIINILSSAGQVSARSPRSFFFSGLNSKLQQQQQQQHQHQHQQHHHNDSLDRRASETTCDYRQHLLSHSCSTANEQYDPLIPESGFKIVIMGTSGSGKTSIIQRFMYNSFNWRHLPTVEDTYFIEFPYMKNIINISISDTSGKFGRVFVGAYVVAAATAPALANCM